ncbi:hypothetical protein A4X09_0g1812 [Tilletia walkeri]|uniref:Uncharacterized protein n=1 Tax=Tilletia walkeri TaxID=117179 RepID=A0A8X7T6E1_9BASI|nr:hypothetical protein A4X09_0g1812 [Tilletia walkeri]
MSQDSELGPAMLNNSRRPSAPAFVPGTTDPEEQRRVTMLLDDLERELLHQRTTSNTGHRATSSISTMNTINSVSNSTAGSRLSRPMGPPPTEPLPQLPAFPSSGSANGSRPSSTSVARMNSTASKSRSAGTSTPDTSGRGGNKSNNSTQDSARQEIWVNGLAGPRASSTFSRDSYEPSHHVTARYTICAADEEEDEAHLSDDSRVLSLSNYHSFAGHGGVDDERFTASLQHHSNSLLAAKVATGSSQPSSPSPSLSPRSTTIMTESRRSMESGQSGAPSTAVPTVMIDDVDDFSDDTADYLDDSEDDARRKRRKNLSNRWKFEDQRAIAPSLSRATAARLAGVGGPSGGNNNNNNGVVSLGLHLAQPHAGPSSSSLTASNQPSSQSFTPGSIVPPTASEFTFYEFAPDLPPFAPKDLKPRDLTGTGTWKSIVARAVTSATASGTHRGSIAGGTESPQLQQNPQPPTQGPVSVRQLAADTRARQQRELVMRQRQAQLFAQTRLEPIDLHRHAQQVATMSERGMSPSPAPSFSTNRGSMVDEGDDEVGPDSLHRGLFRSASVSLSGYWDPLENISAYGGGSTVGAGGYGDEASIRSSMYTNPGLGLDFPRQMVQQKIYADSGTQTSPRSSPPTSRPGSPDEVPENGGAAGESMPEGSGSRAPRKVLAGAGTQTEPAGKRGAASGEGDDDDDERSATPSNERTPIKNGVRSAVGGGARPQVINRRRSTIGIDGRADRADRMVGDEPDGWLTPLRAPRLSSRKSNIGTIGRGSSPTTPSLPRRTSINTLMVVRKPLSPLGLGQGMNKDELAMFNGLSQTEGSDAGISSDDDDSDAGSCESDLDLNTPLEELAERSGALDADARGAKRKFEVQRRTNSAAIANSRISPSSKTLLSGPGLSPASARLDRENSTPSPLSTRVVAPLPRGLRQAPNGTRLGPRGQIGGRALGVGLRAGAARTTAVAYSSDEEDATATETENMGSGRFGAGGKKGGAGAGPRTPSYPRSPNTFTQSRLSRPSLGALRKESTSDLSQKVLAAAAAAVAAAAATPTTPLSAPRSSGTGRVSPSATPTRASAGSEITGKRSTSSLSQRNSPGGGMSIPELDEMLYQHQEAAVKREGADVLQRGSTEGVPLTPHRGLSNASLQEDDDLLTSDIDFAMPPSGESFQSIDDLDGLLDSPHQPNGFGVRSVTGTASLRKPASVPALVTERLGGLSLTETTPVKVDPLAGFLREDAGASASGKVLKGHSDLPFIEGSIGHGLDEDAYASSTLHGHTRAALMKKAAAGGVVTASMDADLDESSAQATPLAATVELPCEREDMASDVSTPEPVKPVSKMPTRSTTPGRSASLSAAQAATPKKAAASTGITRPSSVSEKKVQGETKVETAAANTARQRSSSQTSRIRPPNSGRSSLPMSKGSGLRQPGSFSAGTSQGVEKKGASAAAAAAAGTVPAASAVSKPIRKMKSFGDRSSSSFVSPSISTMPRSRPAQSPSPELNKGMSSGSSRPGSAAASRRSNSTYGGPSRPPSSTSMRRTAIPARKNSDALPSNLPQPPGGRGRSSAAPSPTVGSSSRALSPTTPKKTGLRSSGLERSSGLTAPQKPVLGRASSSPVSVVVAAGAGQTTSPAMMETSPQSQHTPTLSSSSRTSSTSSTDSPPMPSTPALTGPAPSPSPSPATSTARRMASTSNLRKPSSIARPSGLPAPSARSSALPLPKSYKV